MGCTVLNLCRGFFIAEECLQQTLRKITEGVCHPLRVRVEHVLLGEENSQDCILLQDIYVLLQDYNNIISQVLLR